MKRIGVGFLILVGVSVTALVHAQNTLDALDQELNEVKQQHDDATTQNLTNFFAQVDQAMASSDAAAALWQQAGGAMPPATPVTTKYSEETASEKEARLAQDKQNAEALGTVVQFHCGLLHYGALFVTKPDQKGLQNDFNGWLQRAAQAYPQIGALPSPGAADDAPGEAEHHHHHHGGGAAPFNLDDAKGKTMHDSPISSYLGFKAAWKDKDQGQWSVKLIPDLFKANILDPSRATPTQATLDAWDIYIAMKQADQSDPNKWTSNDYPPLQFERASDDYAMAPNADKIEALVQIIHANPTHPAADDWLKRTRKILDDFRAKHGPAPATATAPPAPATTTTASGVTVTTVQQGDAQVIITHTNSTANPAQPH